MKQVVQTLGTGDVSVIDVPAPRASAGHVLIASRLTLISPGTERMLVSFGKASLLEKARQHPDKVRGVVDKIRTDGLMPTLDAVRRKLDETVELGYCNVGTVVEIGSGISGLKVGDRVASNGRHAEWVCVPGNLCARVPDGVSDDVAAFTVLGSVALQGIRIAQPTLGESFAVFGLGVVGLLAVQLLRANGCSVLALDYSEERLGLARSYGAVPVRLGAEGDALLAAASICRGRGIDGAIIAAATDSNDPIRLAARMCRKRGRIVLVGVAGLELSRADFYEKEISFQVSCSYGPGRYDPEYETKGHDYPIGFVRWTEQRNFEAVLDAMADSRIDTQALVSHRFAIDSAGEAYELLASNRPSLGVLLHYPDVGDSPPPVARPSSVAAAPNPADTAVVGLIGAGNQAMQVLLPAFRSAGARFHTAVSRRGAAAQKAVQAFGFAHASTQHADAIASADINTVVVATRHDSHCALACEALLAGRNVFVEKPLALSEEQLRSVESVLQRSGAGARLMVGFNRRFSPHALRMKALLDSRSTPLSAIITVNAGAIPEGHWVQDPQAGGGRIVGEACHFIDLLRFLVGHAIESVSAEPVGAPHRAAAPSDCATITLRFADGSLGTIHYFSNGHRSFPKERIEVFTDNRILQLDNFRSLAGFGFKGFSRMRLWRQDKGNTACVIAFVRSIREGHPAPIPAEEIIEVSRASIAAAQQLSHGKDGDRLDSRA